MSLYSVINLLFSILTYKFNAFFLNEMNLSIKNLKKQSQCHLMGAKKTGTRDKRQAHPRLWYIQSVIIWRAK